MEEQDDESPIKSVRKAIDILDALSDARRALRVGEIASKLNMSVSAVSRLIATLAKGELVHQDEETGRCYLGLGLTVLGANALGRRAIDRIAMPIMDELANRIRGYVSLSRMARGAQFSAAVEAGRADGFAIDDQESAYKHRHVACPIFDHNGNIVAALSGGGALEDFQWSELPTLIQALNHGSLRISRELGFVGEANVNLEAFDGKRLQSPA